MRRFEFRYSDTAKTFLLILLTLFILLPILGLFAYIGAGETALLVIGLIIVFPLIVMTMFLSQSKGYAILHKRHVEIGLGKKMREIEYDRIISVRERTGWWDSHTYWKIKIDGQRNISLSHPLRRKDNETLEQFMKTLKKKAK